MDSLRNLSNGVIDFGEVMISIATCERFEEQDYSKVTDAVKKSSKRGICLETYRIVKIGEAHRACDVFGDVHDIPSDLLRDITLTLKRIGRHEDIEEKTDLIAMTEDEMQLMAINKSTSLEPVWEMLYKYPDKFQDSKELADTMKKEWKIKSRQQKVFGEEIKEHGKIIMLCADDFLRKELIDKMVRCQYAVPFILPITHSSTSKNLIVLWAMKSLVRTYYYEGQEVTKPLVDVKAPLVTFMNIGTERSWKSKLLNKMLSPQQETFWHQALEGGSTAQRISEGMIEVAWWLPGRIGDNKFSCPVTFANLRGDASNSDAICCDLIPASLMTFVFVEGIDITLKEFLRKQRSLSRVTIIVLHRKQTGIKEEANSLRKEFQLEENQIICKEERDNNFNSIHQKIKAAVDNTLSAGKENISLTTLASKMRINKSTMMDDGKSYQGQQAAKTILEDIDEYNRKGKLSAKSEILPFQSDQTSKQKLARLEKEIYRQTDRPEEKSKVREKGRERENCN